jgi:hypothetical protein
MPTNLTKNHLGLVPLAREFPTSEKHSQESSEIGPVKSSIVEVEACLVSLTGFGASQASLADAGTVGPGGEFHYVACSGVKATLLYRSAVSRCSWHALDMSAVLG